MTSVAIITPSIGSDTLEKLVKSVKEQTYDDIVHHIFVDGSEYSHNVNTVLENCSLEKSKYSVNTIQNNIGKGWYGHRVYAACSFLVNQDLIIYLDEDNWIEPEHVESLVKTIDNGCDWAYSLRKIYDKDCNFLCNDDCESLGKWPVYFDDNVFHIDTSSFMVKKQVALTIGHSWYGKWGADRQFFRALQQFYKNYDCTNNYSLCYRLGGNDGSVKEDFFYKGNQTQIEKYGSEQNFPWLKKEHKIGPGISIQM